MRGDWLWVPALALGVEIDCVWSFVVRVFGVWYGGNGYSLSDFESHGEMWGSLGDAKQSLRDRFSEGYWRRDRLARVVDVDGDGVVTPGVVSDDLHPCVGDDCFIELYVSERVGRGRWRVSGDPWARLVLGPRGGVRVVRV